MWILSVFVILPKTLWTTTAAPQPQLAHCKSAIPKFKAKFIRRQLSAADTLLLKLLLLLLLVATIKITKTKSSRKLLTISFIVENRTPNSRSRKSVAARAAVAFSPKQYFSQLEDVERVVVPLVRNRLVKTAFTPFLVSFVALVLIFIIIVIISRIIIIHSIVGNVNVQHYFRRLHNAFLMNDIRHQTLCKPITTTTTITIATTKTIVKTIVIRAIEKLIELTVIKSKIVKAIRTVLENNRNINKNTNKNSGKNSNKNQLIAKTTPISTSNNNSFNTSTNINTSEAANNTLLILYPQLLGLLFTSTSTSPSYFSTFTSSSSSSYCNNNNITVAALVTLRFLFNNNSFSSNNHRTYNNSSKSNKVFLHYTPRDPRLRRTRINNKNKSQEEILFNKHHFDSVSELKITEDLCAYGELIGGSFIQSATTTIIIIILLISKEEILSANVIVLIFCDYNQIKIINNNKNKNKTNFSESACEGIKNKNKNNNSLIISNSSLSEINPTPTDPKQVKFPAAQKTIIGGQEQQVLRAAEVKFSRNLQLKRENIERALFTVGILL